MSNSDNGKENQEKQSQFVSSLADYAKEQQALHWEGTLGDFLNDIYPKDPVRLARTSHQYIWDMMQWFGTETSPSSKSLATHFLCRFQTIIQKSDEVNRPDRTIDNLEA